MSERGEHCCICLESLFAEDTVLGVCHPCGHPIHEQCWQLLEANKVGRGGSRRDMKCPTCNTIGASFTKIFINFNHGLGSVSDEDDEWDDDSSVESSCLRDLPVAAAATAGEIIVVDGSHHNSTQDDNANQRLEDNKGAAFYQEGARADQESTVLLPENYQPQQQEEEEEESVVDLTNNNDPPAAASTTTSNNNYNNNNANKSNRSDDEKATRRKAKRYKKLLKQMKSKYEELSKRQNELHQQVKASQENARAEKFKADRIDRAHNVLLESCRSLELDRIRLEREVDVAESARDAVNKKFKELQDTYDAAKKNYERKIEDAHKSHNVETEAILREYPKVRDRKKELETELKKRNEYVDRLKKRLYELEPTIRSNIEAGLPLEAPVDKRQLKKNLLMMNAMSDENHKVEAQKKRQREQTALQNNARKRCTSRAVQMVEAINGKTNVVTSAKAPSSIDCLLGRDSSKPPKQPLAARRVSIEKTRKTLHLCTTGLSFSKKRKDKPKHRQAGFQQKSALRGAQSFFQPYR